MSNLIESVDEDSPVKVDSSAASLSSVNTKFFLALILTIILCIFQTIYINSANERAVANTEVIYIKMYPNGTWDVEFRKSGDEADFFPLTIDKLIHDYVEARFGKRASNVRRDYGFSIIFMSQPLADNFVGTGPNQFNASKKAEEIEKKKWDEEIKIRFTDHFDVSSGVFVSGNSDIYRTNVFITRTIKNAQGVQQGDPIQEVVNLHWRLKSKKELQKFTRDELRANPVGLEIIEEKINLDVSTSE